MKSYIISTKNGVFILNKSPKKKKKIWDMEKYDMLSQNLREMIFSSYLKESNILIILLKTVTKYFKIWKDSIDQVLIVVSEKLLS